MITSENRFMYIISPSKESEQRPWDQVKIVPNILLRPKLYPTGRILPHIHPSGV